MVRLVAILAAAGGLLAVAVTLAQRPPAPALPDAPSRSSEGGATRPEPDADPAAPPAARPQAEAQPAVPLDRILTWQEERPQPDLFGPRLPPGVEGDPAKPQGALSRATDAVRVDQRTEALGPKGPRQRELDQTDVGVSVPVGGSVQVKGGARVEQQTDREGSTTPTAGVEVKF